MKNQTIQNTIQPCTACPNRFPKNKGFAQWIPCSRCYHSSYRASNRDYYCEKYSEVPTEPQGCAYGDPM